MVRIFRSQLLVLRLSAIQSKIQSSGLKPPLKGPRVCLDSLEFNPVSRPALPPSRSWTCLHDAEDIWYELQDPFSTYLNLPLA